MTSLPFILGSWVNQVRTVSGGLDLPRKSAQLLSGSVKVGNTTSFAIAGVAAVAAGFCATSTIFFGSASKSFAAAATPFSFNPTYRIAPFRSTTKLTGFL